MVQWLVKQPALLPISVCVTLIRRVDLERKLCDEFKNKLPVQSVSAWRKPFRNNLFCAQSFSLIHQESKIVSFQYRLVAYFVYLRYEGMCLTIGRVDQAVFNCLFTACLNQVSVTVHTYIRYRCILYCFFYSLLFLQLRKFGHHLFVRL